MIDFNSVTIRNFLSFGNKPTTVALDGKETILIVGDNRDVGEEGTSKNGSGKSSSIQAIVYALYGKGFDPSLKQDSMVNVINENEMSVELSFSVNNVPCKIVRGRKPNVLTLSIDGEDVTRDSLKNTDIAIEELIGISYDMFVMTIVMSTSVVPFMARKPAEQRKFMEDSLGLTLLTERANTLKEMKKDLEVGVKLAEKDLENAASKNEFIHRQMKQFNDDHSEFERKRNETIEENTKYLESDVVKSFDPVTIIPKLQKYSEYSDELFAMRLQKNELSTSIKNNTRTLESFKSTLESTLESSKKSQEAIRKGEERKVELEKKIIELEPEITEMEAMLVRLLAKKEAIFEVSEMETHMDGFEKYLDEEETKIESLEGELNHLMDEKCPFCLQQYSDEEAEKKIIEIKKMIKEKKAACKIAMDDAERLGEDAEAILSSPEYNDPISDKDVSESLVDDLERKMDSYKSELKGLEKEIKSLEELNDPEAVKSRIDTVKEDISQTEKLIEEANGELADLEDKKKSIEEKIVVLKEWVKTLPEEYNTLELAESYEEEVKLLEKEIEDSKEQKNPHEGYAESLEKDLIDVSEVEEKIKQLEEKKNHCDYLVKLLTNNKSFIRKGIVDQYVGYLNRKINQYSGAVGLSHVIEVNSDLSVDIEYMNRSVGYSNMSAGERLRLDISTAMALRDMLGMLGMKANLTVVDEFLDSATDSSGARKIFNMLKGYSDTVMIISHRPDYDTLVDRKMTVVKQGGFSRIE